MVSDELLPACWSGLGLHIPRHNITATQYEMSQVERDDASQTHLSYAIPPPDLQDGEHLSVAEAAIYLTGAKTNSERAAERREIQTHAFRGKQKTQM